MLKKQPSEKSRKNKKIAPNSPVNSKISLKSIPVPMEKYSTALVERNAIIDDNTNTSQRLSIIERLEGSYTIPKRSARLQNQFEVHNCNLAKVVKNSHSDRKTKFS